MEEYQRKANHQQIKEVELIDEVAFIQALTLIAITRESNSRDNQDSEEFDDDEANAKIDDDEESVAVF